MFRVRLYDTLISTNSNSARHYQHPVRSVIEHERAMCPHSRLDYAASVSALQTATVLLIDCHGFYRRRSFQNHNWEL